MKRYQIHCYINEIDELIDLLEAHGFNDYEVGDKMTGVKLFQINALESDAPQLGKIAKSTLWSRQKDFE